MDVTRCLAVSWSTAAVASGTDASHCEHAKATADFFSYLFVSSLILISVALYRAFVEFSTPSQ